MLDPGVVTTPIRQQVQAFDGDLPVFHAEMLDELLSHALSEAILVQIMAVRVHTPPPANAEAES